MGRYIVNESGVCPFRHKYIDIGISVCVIYISQSYGYLIKYYQKYLKFRM